MTAALDQHSKTLSQLIESCCHSGQSFRLAAEAIEDESLKRLFAIYAQQRERFAQELRGFASLAPAETIRREYDLSAAADPMDLCLRGEQSVLAAYRRALAERALPTRARFLVSAQLALLEKVYSRMQTLAPERSEVYLNKRIAL